MAPRFRFASFTLLAVMPACASGRNWVGELGRGENEHENVRLVDNSGQGSSSNGGRKETTVIGRDETNEIVVVDEGDQSGTRPLIKLEGQRQQDGGPLDGKLLGEFRNTYYDFPAEAEYTGKRSKIYNGQCKAVADVPEDFYQSICVQGSGTLLSGQTVSFAKRDCECANVCARTNQKICFDALDPKDFPFGRGAQGTAIIPLRTIAVDSNVIPLGTAVYIPEFDGLRTSSTTIHDGCFIAEDRGMKVVGKHVDIFTGSSKITKYVNELIPSNKGVRVYSATARCATLLGH